MPSELVSGNNLLVKNTTLQPSMKYLRVKEMTISFYLLMIIGFYIFIRHGVEVGSNMDGLNCLPGISLLI